MDSTAHPRVALIVQAFSQTVIILMDRVLMDACQAGKDRDVKKVKMCIRKFFNYRDTIEIYLFVFGVF
jgi:hypothetical protein